MSHQQIYIGLSPYYKLLYIHDIDSYPISELKQLHKELQDNKKENMSKTSRQLHDLFIKASNQNFQRKILAKKKSQQNFPPYDNPALYISNQSTRDSAKKSIKKEININNFNQSSIRDLSQQQSCSFYCNLLENMEDKVLQSYQPTNKKLQKQTNLSLQILQGAIIEGQGIAQFNLSDRLKYCTIKAIFKINFSRQQSTISQHSLLELGLKSQTPTLMLNGRQQKFQKGGQNMIGLNYLKQQRAKMRMTFNKFEDSHFQIFYTK